MIANASNTSAQKTEPLELAAEDAVLAAERLWPHRDLITWEAVTSGLYSCEVRLVEEGVGGFSVYVPQLSGVVSEGETVEEAKEHIKEALAAAIETYVEDGQEVPWQPPESTAHAEGETSRWVLVHV